MGSGPLGNGSSLPEAAADGGQPAGDGPPGRRRRPALGLVCDFFDGLAVAEELPVGRPQDFDAAFLHHQIAGGVMTTTRRQLREIGMEHRFEALVEEVGAGPGRARPPDHGHAVPADGRVPGAVQRDRRAVRERARPGHPVRAGQLRPADRADRPDRARTASSTGRGRASWPPSRRRRRPPSCGSSSAGGSATRSCCCGRTCRRSRSTRCSPPARRRGTSTRPWPPCSRCCGNSGSRPSVHDLAVTKPGLRMSVRRASGGTSVA